MLESDLQAQIIDYLQVRRIHHIRMQLGGIPHSVKGEIQFKKNNMAGFPDIWGLQITGQVWGMEVKRTGGKLSQKQLDCHKFLRKFSAELVTIYSFDQAKNWIDEYRGVFVKYPESSLLDPKNPWSGF